MSDPAPPPEPPAALPRAEPLQKPRGEARRGSLSPLPLLGGNLGIGIMLLAGIALVSPNMMNNWLDRTLHPQTPKPVASWKVGEEADVELTVITADSRRLNCAHDQELEGLHCGFTAAKRPWPRPSNALLDDNDERVIQPYRTADTNALILVAGLWAQPEVALRLHREPPTPTEIDKQLRFVAYCKVRFIGELKGGALRWESPGKWLDHDSALVAKPVHCTLTRPAA